MRKSSMMMSFMALALAGIMSDESNYTSLDNKKSDLTDDEYKRIKDARERSYKKIMLNKGIKEFDINGFKILALNYKNALRKAKNAQALIEHCKEYDNL